MLSAEDTRTHDDKWHTDPTWHRPLYADRHPPLVQPLKLSAFAEKALVTFGSQDLAHEWIFLFQTVIGSNQYPHQPPNTVSRSPMKMNIPDTVFLSPSGHPSIWFRTASSKHIKIRGLSHTTPRSVYEVFRSGSNGVDNRCAVVYEGYVSKIFDHFQLQEIVRKMDKACIRRLPKQEHVLGQSGGGFDLAYGRGTVGDPSEPDDLGSKPQPFCVQRFIKRARDVTFLCLWTQYPTSPHARYASRDLEIPSKGTKMRASNKVYVIRRGPVSNLGDSVQESAGDVVLELLDLEDGNDGNARKILNLCGFDAEAAIPLLLQMKLLTSELVSRMNRACGASRQVKSLACEYFLSDITKPQTNLATSLQVFFSCLAGIGRQGRAPSWETLREIDPMSRAICDRLVLDETSMPRRLERGTRFLKLQLQSKLSLEAFDELNPRFPSVNSPLVDERQWKAKAALLPPYVSPRYLGAEMPKTFRDGQFHPMLTPRQSDTVNRLQLTNPEKPLPDFTPKHPLSRKHADVERELWAQRDIELEAQGFIPRSPRKIGSPRGFRRVVASGSPKSPRHRHSLIKEELI